MEHSFKKRENQSIPTLRWTTLDLTDKDFKVAIITCDVMKVLTNAMVVIMLQYIRVSNQHAVPL